MGDLPPTRPSLLLRLRDGLDHDAWACFVQVYGPVIYRFARKQGLQDADAADLLQETLRVVSSAVKQLDYDPQRGAFRSWLFAVVRNQLLSFWSRRDRVGGGTGGTSAHQRLAEAPANDSDQAGSWDPEYERSRFAWAAARVQKQVKPTTWQAFWKTAIEGHSGEEVAATLGITVAAVYLAKSRVMVRLKEQIKQTLGD